jgi:hypothetical protein
VPLNVGSDTATDADSDSEVTQTGSDPQVKGTAKSCEKRARPSKQTAGTSRAAGKPRASRSGAAAKSRAKVSAEADAAKGSAVHIGPKRQKYSLGRSRSDAQGQEAVAGLKEQLDAHHRFTQVCVFACASVPAHA